MGLLGDNWADPQSQGLLALSSGLLQGKLGQGVADMNQTMMAAPQMALHRQLLGMQLQEAQQGLAQKQQSMDFMRRGMEMLQGGGGSNVSAQPGQLGSGTFGAVSPPAGQSDIGKSGADHGDFMSRIASFTPDQVAQFQTLTGKDITPLWKIAKEGFTRNPNTYVTDASSGKTKFYGDPSKGFGMDENNNVVPMPGFASTASANTYATKDAELRATNENTPVKPGDFPTLPGQPAFTGTMADLVRSVRQTPTAQLPATQMPTGQQSMLTKGNAAIGPGIQASIAKDAAENGITNPLIGAFNSSAKGPGVPILDWPQSPGMAPQAPVMATGAPRFAGPLDMEKAKAGIEIEKAGAVGAQAAGQAYQNVLHDKVEGDFMLVNRNKQIEPLLDKFTTGAMGAEQRLHFGNIVANSGMLPQSVKGPLSNWIANGDPTAGKVIDNQLAAAGISSMLQALDKQGKPNRAEFQVINDAKESLNSGNATLKDVFALQRRLYDIHYGEQQALTGAIKGNTYSPTTWAGDYSAVRNAGLDTAAEPLPSAQTNIPQGAINTLKLNPKLRGDFDAKYGAGASTRVLGK